MSPRNESVVQVFVAACTGSATLMGSIGLPIVHVDVAIDAAAAIRRLNQREHGSGVRVSNLFQPIGFDSGWSDWGFFDYRPGPWRRGMGARPEGVRAVEGRLEIHLPCDVAITEFREELQAGLRHLRLHEVTSEMSYMEARSDACQEYIVEPRYTWNPRDQDFRGATRVNDIYVLDPAERPWRLFWIVVAARAAVIDGASTSWR